MRTMPAPLLAAQKSSSRVPYVKVEAHNRVAHIRRLAWTRLYTGSEPDNYHSMIIAGDGSLCRVRISSTNILYQRVANPSASSDFSTWTTLITGASGWGATICGSGNRVMVLYNDGAGQFKARESTDYGATFGAAVNVGATGQTRDGPMAAGMRSDGDTVMVFTDNAHVLKYAKRTGGTWGAIASAGYAAFNATRGIGGLYTNDWNFAVAYQEATTLTERVDTFIFGDGYAQGAGTWSALREVYRASSGSNVTLNHPFIGQADLIRLSFVENYSGTVAYKRPNLSNIPPLTDYSSTGWREPVPFNLDSTYGLALAGQWPDYFWASTPSGVWQASLTDTPLDLAPDILELQATAAANKAGQLRVALDNSDGAYNTLPAPLAIGAELWVYLGYQTSSGNQSANPLAYWIDEIEYVSGNGKAQLVLHARDGWGLLEDWIARRQYTFSSQNVFQIHNIIAGRVGFAPTAIGSQSSHFTSFQPAFTINPGESGVTAMRRLFQNVQDEMFFIKDFCYTTWPQSTDSAVYSYGGAGNHPIISARYAALTPRANRVQVFGSAANFAEKLTWSGDGSIEGKHRDTIREVHDQNLTSSTLMTERYNAEQRDIDIHAAAGELLVPLNSGQDVYDVIPVTDAAAGKSATRYRVLGHLTVYDRQRGIYQQRLTLGAP